MRAGVQIDLSGLTAGLAKARERLNAARRPAAQAGAQLIYEAAHANVPVSLKGHFFYGSASKAAPKGAKKGKAYYFDAGSLKKALYQVYSKDKSGPARDQYEVSWNRTEAPYGHMVEFGTSRAPAHPFLGPAIHDNAAAAQAAISQRFIAEVTKQ